MAPGQNGSNPTYSTAGFQSLLDEAIQNLRAASGTTQSLELCLNTDMTFLCLIWRRRRKRRMSLVRRISRWMQDHKLLEVRIFIQLEVYTTGSDGRQLNQFPLIP